MNNNDLDKIIAERNARLAKQAAPKKAKRFNNYDTKLPTVKEMDVVKRILLSDVRGSGSFN
jgi:hypothetical protein